MFVVLVKDNANDYWFCYGPFTNKLKAQIWVADTCTHLDANRVQIREVLSIWPWEASTGQERSTAAMIRKIKRGLS